MKAVMVTGASGFVGSALCCELARTGYAVIAVVRRVVERIPSVTYIEADLADPATFAGEFPTVDCIIHLAGRAHILTDKVADPLATFREVNRDATVRLAARALKAGVKRFVFVSSIGVNGNSTRQQAFNEDSPASPHVPYAISKYEAEQELGTLLRGKRMELVVVRPPLIYANDAPGNFGRLLKLVASGLPLPLDGVRNARSLISRRNIVGFLSLCAEHPDAAGELFLVADGEDVSTAQMIEALSRGMGRRPALFTFPAVLLKLLMCLLGKASMHEQLCGSLQVDASKARRLLGWVPVETIGAGLQAAGREYILRQRERRK